MTGVTRAMVDAVMGAVQEAEGGSRRAQAARVIAAVKPHLQDDGDTATVARYRMALETIASGNCTYASDLAKRALRS